ncbi:histone-lysine N-methyltransferase SETMAR [Elysia marginata]|uniref:Histone-lysine N-methyltransferase SETMAR n=1 Tax=Elysia marginata TaxID=1093978 RepID=A0AAV4H598_9GAST|nr:histone-lysine N-methyltransferase SETMAR [Elysia marginata]
MSRPRVYQWCIWFEEGRTSLDDEPKSGRTKTSTSEENTTRVDELIKCDRRIKMGEIALKLEIPSSTVHKIVHDTLGYLKVSARWVPKMLTEDHKLQRVEISRRLLLRYQQDNGDEDTTHIGVGLGGDFQAKNNLFDNLITDDETWVHLNAP